MAYAVAQGWAGIEALSGIPGSTGATPVQNVGAYGQEVAQTIVAVHAYDRVKPDVVAPGADIVSSFPNQFCEEPDPKYRHAAIDVLDGRLRGRVRRTYVGGRVVYGDAG